jgi:hypothetical protein
MSINNINRAQSQPLAHDVSAGSPKQGATPGGTPVEVQTPKPQTGFLSKIKAGFSSFGSSISAGFKSLSRSSTQSAPPGPARATTAAVNEQAKVAGQAKAACTFLLSSIPMRSLSGVPVVNVSMAKEALTDLFITPQAARESSMQSLVKAMSGAELSQVAEGLTSLSPSMKAPGPGSTERDRSLFMAQSNILRAFSDIVGQEQRSRALTPDNFSALANMVVDGKSITVSGLISLPESHPARLLFSAFQGREFTPENFNFCKAMDVVLKQTDPVTQNAMIKDIAAKMDLAGVNTNNHDALNTAFSLAHQTNDYLACLPELIKAETNAASMANKDTIRARFSTELLADLCKLAPKAHQGDLMALKKNVLPEALTSVINSTMASNRAADPFADLFGRQDNLGASPINSTLAALLDEPSEQAPSSSSLAQPANSAVPSQAGVSASASASASAPLAGNASPIQNVANPLSQIREREQLIASLPGRDLSELQALANVTRDNMKQESVNLVGTRASAAFNDAKEFMGHVNKAIVEQLPKLASSWVQHFNAVNGEAPKSADFLKLSADHPARMAFDLALTQLSRTDQSMFLARFEGVSELTLAQARSIAEDFIASNTINLEGKDIAMVMRQLGGTVESMPVAGSSLNYVDTVVWADRPPQDNATPPIRAFDDSRAAATRLLDANLGAALATEYFVAPQDV